MTKHYIDNLISATRHALLYMQGDPEEEDYQIKERLEKALKDTYPSPPSNCPVCESDDISGQREGEDELIFVYCSCRDCQTSWTETYRFTHWDLTTN